MKHHVRRQSSRSNKNRDSRLGIQVIPLPANDGTVGFWKKVRNASATGDRKFWWKQEAT